MADRKVSHSGDNYLSTEALIVTLHHSSCAYKCTVVLLF